MSAIAGIFHFDGGPVAPGDVEKMTAAMAHRGPDGIVHWQAGSVALGQCMLRTTPEAMEEVQPWANEDQSLVLVLDGRVDNYDDLRSELIARGAVLRNRSDAELVLRAYETWGEASADRIIGEFAYFVWDARERRLFGARDAAGTRHFYYHAGREWFAFASEIKGLLALGRIEARLNESRLFDYLVQEFDRDDEVSTFYQDILRLPAGHAMRCTAQGATTWRYWNPADLAPLHFSSANECTEAYMDQLRIAVSCRLRSNGPVAAKLSGGLDSSTIVGIVAKDFRHSLRQPLRTLSLILEERHKCPEWNAIQRILEDDWLEPTIITSALPLELRQRFLDQIERVDEPFTLSHALTEFVLYDAAHQQGSRVVLEGMAGDLHFYDYYRSLDTVFRDRSWRLVRPLLAGALRHRYYDAIPKLARRGVSSVTPERVRALYRRLRGNRVAPGKDERLLHRDLATRFATAKREQRRQANERQRSDTDQARHAARFTSGLLSFAHETYGPIALGMGMEPRSPFSDRRLIEFAIRMPVRSKMALSWYKPVLRAGTSGALPDTVRWRRDIGNHPGWDFYRRLIADIARHAPEAWSLERLDGILKPWIDQQSLSGVWRRFARKADAATGFDLYALVVLARWLSDHSDVARSSSEQSLPAGALRHAG